MAALDVTTPEPLPLDHPLLKCNNCIVVPHWGYATEQSCRAMVNLAIQNALAAIEGKTELPTEVFEKIQEKSKKRKSRKNRRRKSRIITLR